MGHSEFFVLLDKGIAALFLVLRTVKELELKRLKHVTGKGLKSTTSKTLRSVNLEESSSFTDAGVKVLVQNCPNIEELNLSELHKLSDAAIIAAAESLKDNLVSVYLLVWRGPSKIVVVGDACILLHGPLLFTGGAGHV